MFRKLFRGFSKINCWRENAVSLLELNAPESLNALDHSMFLSLQEHIQKSNEDLEIVAMLFTGVGHRAFCAGGDIRAMYFNRDPVFHRDFFWAEYLSDYLAAKMRPFQVVFYDGIAMGGGIGITAYAPIRIVTEKTVFAMPETRIGYFPDVSSSYFLTRLPNRLGLYLGLTGAELTGPEMISCGLATHFIDSHQLPTLKKSLIEKVTEDFTLEDLNKVVGEFSQEKCKPIAGLATIEEVFSQPTSLEEIFEKLKSSEWGLKLLRRLKKMSPLSLKVGFEEFRRGKQLSLEECLMMEFRMSQHFMQRSDVFEGVRAQVIDKDRQPRWRHKGIEEISDELVASYFEPVGGDLPLLAPV